MRGWVNNHWIVMKGKEMLFNSYVFVLLFLPLTLLGYFILNHYGWYKAAICELAIMSFVFYAYNNIKYIWILGVSIIVNWMLAGLLCRVQNKNLTREGGETKGHIINRNFN